MLNQAKIIDQARRLNDNAKDGTLKIGDASYAFTFQRNEGIYSVTDPSGKELTRFNTRKLTVARQWLRDYFAN